MELTDLTKEEMSIDVQRAGEDNQQREDDEYIVGEGNYMNLLARMTLVTKFLKTSWRAASSFAPRMSTAKASLPPSGSQSSAALRVLMRWASCFRDATEYCCNRFFGSCDVIFVDG